MLHKLRDLRRWPVWVRLGLTGSVLVAAHLFQIPLETEVPGEPFLLFFLIVIAAALLFGEATGLFAAVASTFLSFFFFEPYGTMALVHAHDLVQVELYGLLAIACVVGFARLARAFIAAQEATEELERSEQSRSLLSGRARAPRGQQLRHDRRVHSRQSQFRQRCAGQSRTERSHRPGEHDGTGAPAAADRRGDRRDRQ